MSSAGVYLKSDQMPHVEGDPVDPKSRHKGKHDTEFYLAEQNLPFTSIRPTYIYGPQNYNDLEAWFLIGLCAIAQSPYPEMDYTLPNWGMSRTWPRQWLKYWEILRLWARSITSLAIALSRLMDWLAPVQRRLVNPR